MMVLKKIQNAQYEQNWSKSSKYYNFFRCLVCFFFLKYLGGKIFQKQRNLTSADNYATSWEVQLYKK